MALTFLVMIYIVLEIAVKNIQFQKLTPIAITSHKNFTNFDNSTETNNFFENPNFPIVRPFYPNFIDFLVQLNGLYESIPILPGIFSNARNQENFGFNVKLTLVALASYTILYSPFAILAYGTKL